MLAPFHRHYELPWEIDPEVEGRYRKILRAALAMLVLLALLFTLLPAPKQAENEVEVPRRLARIMIEEQPKPRPPPPAPKVAERPRPVERPVQVPRPVERTEQARRRARKSGLLKYQDELADLRQDLDVSAAPTRNLTGAVGASSHAERSLLTAKVGAGSGGINAASVSRGFGSGAGSLSGHRAATVTSAIAREGLAAGGPTRTGSSGKAARSAEEIALVFDRNKGAIYALYSRALRSHPELQGKLVLEFTISPAGVVTMCRIVSSDLHDPELERLIIARVRLFRFEPENVAPITTTKPIDFFPA